MKVLVCGGRDYKDRETVFNVLDSEKAKYKVSMIIHGDARGADRLADLWAEHNGVQSVRCPANWTYYGKFAGHHRNSMMLGLDPDYVVAFPGGRGTANMVLLAKEKGIQVIEFTTE